jgi:surfactin synthase thioesterase subunit
VLHRQLNWELDETAKVRERDMRHGQDSDPPPPIDAIPGAADSQILQRNEDAFQLCRQSKVHMHGMGGIHSFIYMHRQSEMVNIQSTSRKY